MFDQRLNKILDDPSDDTKGFLDPNTGENLTYLELIERCINDAETDLILLPLVKVDETHLYKDRLAFFIDKVKQNDLIFEASNRKNYC